VVAVGGSAAGPPVTPPKSVGQSRLIGPSCRPEPAHWTIVPAACGSIRLTHGPTRPIRLVRLTRNPTRPRLTATMRHRGAYHRLRLSPATTSHRCGYRAERSREELAVGYLNGAESSRCSTFGYSACTERIPGSVIFADTPANVAMVIVQRLWIAYFRAGQRSRSLVRSPRDLPWGNRRSEE
jgi:hypothetical protein